MKTFLTQVNRPGPQIEAIDFEHAELIAKEKERGLTVVGKHILTISREGFTVSDADKMCKALADEIRIEGD